MQKIKGILLLLLTTFLWGSAYVVTKGVVDDAPTILFVAARFLVAGIFILLISIKKLKKLNKKTVAAGILMGAFFGFAMTLQVFGIKYTSAGKAAFLTSAYCVFMPFLEWIIIKNKPKARGLIAAVLGMVGIGCIALTEALTIGIGEICTLGGSVLYGLQIVYFAIFMKENDMELMNMIMCFSAAVILGIVSVFTEDLSGVAGAVSMPLLLALLYLGVFCNGLALVTQGRSQQYVTPSLVAILLCFEPVFASILSSIVFGEVFTLRTLIGSVLILVSVIMSSI